ncbi:hypothetical protein ACFPIJ_64265 [Dactylosporangium cerinum]|uniref:Uncharacterized protein n=1 Tax=Dactylosporangium cerinum TaxID=1434730 RepID=A0ABV9WKR9_9ACTN
MLVVGIRPYSGSFVFGEVAVGADALAALRVEVPPYVATLSWPDDPDVRVDVTPHGAAECSIAIRRTPADRIRCFPAQPG